MVCWCDEISLRRQNGVAWLEMVAFPGIARGHRALVIDEVSGYNSEYGTNHC